MFRDLTLMILNAGLLLVLSRTFLNVKLPAFLIVIRALKLCPPQWLGMKSSPMLGSVLSSVSEMSSRVMSVMAQSVLAEMKDELSSTSPLIFLKRMLVIEEL